MGFMIRSAAFGEGETIPRRHTCEGENVSPALDWSGAPPHTRGFALLCDDPDAPGGVWTHWMLWDLPPTAAQLAEGYSPEAGVKTGTNDFGRPGYGGPCPPKGHGPHRYSFKLFALNVASLGLKPGVRRREFDAALKGKILAETWCMGRYERK